MFLSPEGAIVFSDGYELTYNLLNNIGLSIDNNGYIYDNDNGIHIQFHGFKLKGTVDQAKPCYAGDGEVVFDVFNNIRLVQTMLGYCLSKEQHTNPEFDSVANYIEDIPDTKMTALCIKMASGEVKSTHYYINKCLKYTEGMFLIYDEYVDLRNFDTLL